MDKIKKITPKKILIWSLFVLLLVLIIVLTIIPIVFDLDNLDINKWITNSLISVGIMIAAIILGELTGEDKQKEKVGGLYQNSLKAFNDELNTLTITNPIIIYFSQFYTWFKARELKNKKIGYLVDNGFEQQLAKMIVTCAEVTDVPLMTQQVVIKKQKDGKEVKFKKMTEEEVEIIEDIFSVNFGIDAPSYTYYLSAFGDSSSSSTLEQAKEIERKERSNKAFNRTFKIICSLFISLIWGMATVQDITEGGTREAIINLISRLVALFGGLLSGYITSVMSVKLASQKLDNKTQVLKFFELYTGNGEFKAKSYDELVDEEIVREKCVELETKEEEK